MRKIKIQSSTKIVIKRLAQGPNFGSRSYFQAFLASFVTRLAITLVIKIIFLILKTQVHLLGLLYHLGELQIHPFAVTLKT